jgi:FkbM family methyltransferase
MALNQEFIARRVLLGSSFPDKVLLALFGLMSPSREPTDSLLQRSFARLVPNFSLRPERLNGLRLTINPLDWSQTVIFEEVFLEAGYDLAKVKFVPQVVIDCGAHIGIFSLLAKSKFPSARVRAYEPNPRNIRLIRKQIARNRLDIDLVEAAISTETREDYFAGTNSHNGTLLHDKSSSVGYKVQVVDFPEALGVVKPKSLLLKMDVEGEERRILPALIPSLPRQTALFFETHDGEAGWREIESLLISNGFRVEIINSRGRFFDGFAQRESNETT